MLDNARAFRPEPTNRWWQYTRATLPYKIAAQESFCASAALALCVDASECCADADDDRATACQTAVSQACSESLLAVTEGRGGSFSDEGAELCLQRLQSAVSTCDSESLAGLAEEVVDPVQAGFACPVTCTTRPASRSE